MLKPPENPQSTTFAGQSTGDGGTTGDDRAAPGLVLPARLGSYELLSTLGRGGKGIVYRAVHLETGAEFALKTLQNTTCQELGRFDVEIRALEKLKHPNIVELRDHGICDGIPYYTMPLIHGMNLQRYARSSHVTVQQAARISAELAAAIEYLHENKIIHRDLKPLNVLLDESGSVKLTDFGLAKLLDEGASLTATGAILGTWLYMAPEQVDGTYGETGTRTDIYGIGAVLYFLLTGSAPIEIGDPSSHAAKLCKLVATAPRLAPSLRNDQVDESLDSICLKCLQLHPDDRYADAASLRHELEQYLSDLSIKRKVSPARRWTRHRLQHASHIWRYYRRRCLAALIGVAVLLSFAAAAIERHLTLQQDRERSKDYLSLLVDSADLLDQVEERKNVRNILGQFKELLRVQGNDPDVVYNAACAHAIAADRTLAQKGSPKEADELEARAVELLYQAKENGYFYNRQRKINLFHDRYLKTLADRDDFQKFHKPFREQFERERAEWRNEQSPRDEVSARQPALD
jgi:serine/threonine protein kinase